MAASGGFWAKGSFVTAVDVAVASQTMNAFTWGDYGFDMIKQMALDNMKISHGQGDMSTADYLKANTAKVLGGLLDGTQLYVDKVPDIETALGDKAHLLQQYQDQMQAQLQTKPTAAAADVEAKTLDEWQKINNQGLGDEAQYGQLEPTYSEWYNNLTLDEQNAILSYTGSGYGVNKWLREDKTILPHYGWGWTGDLDNALNKAPGMPINTMAFRGFGNETIHKAAAAGLLKPGSQLIDKAYMSTSTQWYTGKNFTSDVNGVFYRIRVPKGSKAAFLGEGSKHGSEREILWGKNAPMTVLKVEMGTVGNTKNVAIIDLVPTEGVK